MTWKVLSLYQGRLDTISEVQLRDVIIPLVFTNRPGLVSNVSHIVRPSVFRGEVPSAVLTLLRSSSANNSLR